MDVVSLAARRRGIPIVWVQQAEAEAALRQGKVDLWPLLGDIPVRRTFLHISPPWLTLSFWMISLTSRNIVRPEDTAGRALVHNTTEIDRRLASEHFPLARRRIVRSPEEVLELVCKGAADAGMISGSIANSTDLRSVAACRGAGLRLRLLPNARIPFGVASSKFNTTAARAADAIREEIAAMAADGALSTIYFRWYRDPNNDAMALFYLSEAQRMNRILLAGVAVLMVMLILLGWQTHRVRQARFAADRANRVKSEFLANMSHEIRTPMNAVIGMISLVLEQCKDADQRAYLKDAHDAARSLTILLNDILDLSKVEAGRMTFESVPFQVRPLVEGVIRMFEAGAKKKGLDLELRVSHDCPDWVTGDSSRLKQVLVNLTGNALKFTNKGGVLLHVSPQPERGMRFTVTDTGVGIPREELDRIFEPFTQADGSHTRQFGGTGLGLAISRRLVTLMGGEIRARSVSGSGSEFVVELPLERCEPPAVADKDAPAGEARLDGMRLLVAEDNLVNQKVVSAMLSRQGASVTLARNGEQACREFERSEFDAVLMDVQMPVMDGFQATEWIRDLERRSGHPAVPILALTAHASDADRNDCRAAGMDYVITKPVEVRSLVSALTAVVKRARAQGTPGLG